LCKPKFKVKQCNLGDDNGMIAPESNLREYFVEVFETTSTTDFDGEKGLGMIIKAVGLHSEYISFLSKDIFIGPDSSYATRQITRSLLGGNLTLNKINEKLTQPIFNRGITEGLKVGH